MDVTILPKLQNCKENCTRGSINFRNTCYFLCQSIDWNISDSYFAGQVSCLPLITVLIELKLQLIKSAHCGWPSSWSSTTGTSQRNDPGPSLPPLTQNHTRLRNTSSKEARVPPRQRSGAHPLVGTNPTSTQVAAASQRPPALTGPRSNIQTSI
jgi:hypothetical protein